MSNMLKTVVIISGIIIFLNAAGIETNSGGLVKELLNGGLTNFQNTDFWSDFVIVLTVGAGVGITASLFGRTPDTSILIAALVAAFGGLVLFDMFGIYSQLYSLGESWIQWVASAIFVPMAIGFFIIILNWWRGND